MTSVRREYVTAQWDENGLTCVWSGKEHYVPLDKSVMDRSLKIKRWIQDWWSNSNCPMLKMLEVKDWFTEAGHESECTLWSPCPLLADIMLEELCDARLK